MPSNSRWCGTALLCLMLCGCAVTRPARVAEKPGARQGSEEILLEEQAEPTAVLFDYWTQSAQRVRARLGDVGDRSKLLGPDVRRLGEVFDGMFRVHREGMALIEEAGKETDGYAQQVKLDAASARLEALWLGLRVVTVQLNYLLLADAAENAGVVSTHWLDMLNTVRSRTEPIMKSLVGFDARRMEDAARAYGPGLAELDSLLPRWEKAISLGTVWSSRAIRAADATMLAFAAYETYQALGTLGGGGPDLTFRFPGLVTPGAGGAATAATVVIPAEVLESIRKLIELGAISNAVLSAGAGPLVGRPELVGGGRLEMRAMSGANPTASSGQGKGPGNWQKVKEGMKARAAKYQTQITGRPPGEAYVVKGVRFDGFRSGVLLEAKGPGYAKFVKGGEFREWFRGDEVLLKQAEHQEAAARAAGNIRIEWHVAERELADVLRKAFGDRELRLITIVYTPVTP